MFGRVLGLYIIYTFFGALVPNGILRAAKFTLRPSLAFSYIGSVTARHLSSGRQPNFAAWYKKWNYGTFGEAATYIWLGGHHIGHRPTYLHIDHSRFHGRESPSVTEASLSQTAPCRLL